MATSYESNRRFSSMNGGVRAYGSINNDIREGNVRNQNLHNAEAEGCRYVSENIGGAIGKFIYYTAKTFTSLLCIGKMSVYKRIAVLWIWIVVLGLGGGLVVWLVVYPSQEISGSVTDMRVVSRKDETIFSTDITVTTSDVIDVYLMPEFPPLRKERRAYNIPQNTTLNSDTFTYWGFYLIYGSTFRVTSDVTGDWINMFVIKGADNMDEWKKSKTCTDCYLKKNTFENGASYETDLDITSSDKYFILYSKNSGGTARVSANIHLNKTEYDLSTSTSKCAASTDCTFDLHLGSEQTVVIDIGQVQKTFELHISVSSTPREWLYLVLFLAVPVITGLVTSYMVYKLVKVVRRCREKSPTYLAIDEDNVHIDRNSIRSVDQDSFSGSSSHHTCSHTQHHRNQQAELTQSAHVITTDPPVFRPEGLPFNDGCDSQVSRSLPNNRSTWLVTEPYAEQEKSLAENDQTINVPTEADTNAAIVHNN